jgi:uncharacterized DUF497 family protein
MIQFDWDETKNWANRKKHGIWFEEAVSVFDDPDARLFADPDHSDQEEREVIVGISSATRLLTIVHCYLENDAVVRIISARRATTRETEFYAQGI